MLKIQENVLLKDFTTLGVGGKARYFVVVKTEDDLKEVLVFAKSRKLSLFVLGGGSNILISDHGFSGLVIKNEIKGIKFTNSLNDKVILEVGVGEILDEVIALSVSQKLFGLENLSGIPGTVGGAAVQNAGAYGVEIKDCLLSVEGLNITNGKKFVFDKLDCQFGYRDSIFKKNKKFIITAVTLELSKKVNLRTEYAGLKNILSDKQIIKAEDIRKAILKIREDKLPDWHILPTAGSFFMNPIISEGKYLEFKERFEEIPGFPESKGKIKVPLAWILDNVCKLKGYTEGNVGLYDKQPLILVNNGGATEKEINTFAEKIKKIVLEKTGIEIKMEVEKI